ncbi:flavin reductase family protein [Streptomyces arenae]|uniref:flavin reductase family protein n=1 Tax=Streptomyces arenae TaxID=29301 RepID=UPI002659CC94|nr:flavin reductase family protein [Streptomyces arenae]MCG7205597.1 flavin reductase family protein [Streptomyces arenae]
MSPALLADQTSATTAPDLADSFRAAMSALAAPVTIVTCYDDRGRPRGLTASAVSSLSLAPPLFLVCLDRASRTHDVLTGAEDFAVHLLGPGEEHLVDRFTQPAEQRFAGLPLGAGPDRAPVIAGVSLVLRCVRHRLLEGGDHTILVGRVTEVSGEPAHAGGLLWHRRGFAHARRP